MELNAQKGVPRPDHVVVVVEENKTFQQIFNSPEAPYINALAGQGALFISSFAIRHPSEPNYLALFSGSTQGIGDDSCPHSFNSPNLGAALIEAGLTFAGYSESMPSAGFLGCDAGPYARRHNPWSNFPSIPADANLPFTAFPTNYENLPSLAFVVPNLDNDMHDGPIPRGDEWLRTHLDNYIQWAQTHNSLFVLTWDEGGNNQIFTLMVGPMVRPGQYCERIDHYTVLRTLLDLFRLMPFGLATNVDAITSAWRPETVDSPVQVAIMSPEDGASLAAPFVLRAEAASTEGSIARVEFFEGPTALGVVTEPPFELNMSNVVAGPHCYVVKAMNTAGARRTSASIQITATSASNAFATAAGSYAGLFFETNRLVNDHAGSLDVVVDPQGTLSARLSRGGHRAGATGKFTLDGAASVMMEPTASEQVMAELHLGLPPNVGFITGRILGANWEAPLVAYRSDFRTDHPSPQAGRYTVRLAGPAGDDIPRGEGVMAATIGSDGKVVLAGTLADGTRIVQRTISSASGDVPFYRSLYHNGGSIIGWLKFAHDAPTPLAAEVVWTKPAMPTDPRYPMGFQINPTAEAALYSFPGLTNWLATTMNLQVTFDLGPSLAWTNAVVFNLPSHRLIGDHGLVLTLAPAKGLWSGRYTDPVTRKSWPLNATVLQPEQMGAGYVLTPERSGAIAFGPSH